MAEVKKVVFKATGPHKDKDVNLGSGGQYKFVKGKCVLECNEDDAKKHAHILKKYYGCVRVKPKGEDATPTPEDLLPDESEVDAAEAKEPAKGKKK